MHRDGPLIPHYESLNEWQSVADRLNRNSKVVKVGSLVILFRK